MKWIGCSVKFLTHARGHRVVTGNHILARFAEAEISTVTFCTPTRREGVRDS